jgi:DNA topoisomerase I
VSSKPLVVVESPTKVRTIQKYLGNDFAISATVGHIKDLPAKEMGIDIEDGFKPKYRVIPGKQKVISQLKQAAGDATDIYLAPDPDREGEAIAWHTAEVLKKQGRRFHRVLFHELTPNAIKAAMAAPDELDRSKYEAQQARRILDRIVGYEISPLLWRKVKRGLSAGRVQSVAVRIICDRERAIQIFIPEEYWSITAHLTGSEPPPFAAKLVRHKGKKLKIPDETTTNAILSELAGKPADVKKVARKQSKRNPAPPFTTSTLQQEAIRKLKFSAKKTMTVAQQLYEGIELGPGELVGLITYMRTDSTRIADDAAKEAIALVRERFGDDYAIPKPRAFKNRKKAQDAHEAIRPTSVLRTPEEIGGHLTPDQRALYTLIWQRFTASQMAPAQIETLTVTVAVGDYEFTAAGSKVVFPGFMVLYGQETEGEGDKAPIPALKEGERLTVNRYEPKQHFTQPPPRFSEATLVKELEENGIGRPSTYAAILSTIRDKGYVEMLKGYFRPSELGFIVNDLVVKNFPDILDVDFTAKMEDDLDRVESADEDSLALLGRFYHSFKKNLDAADEQMLSLKRDGLPTELTCPQCGKPLHIKMGRNGLFLACSGYPDCSFTRDYVRDEKGGVQPVEPPPETQTDKVCRECGRPMVVKRGRYGSFLACTGFPECKYTENLPAEDGGRGTGVTCPESGCGGELVERRSKRGRVFYGCSRFPDCRYATWDRPVDRPCPVCNAPFLVEKTTKKEGTVYVCPNRKCGHREAP